MVTFSDSRIVEASGLSYARKMADRLHVVNDDDDGNNLGFTVQPSTGNTVGTWRVKDRILVDIESLSGDPLGRLWVADIGNNDSDPDREIALYMRDEPGDGNRGAVPFNRFALEYPDGPHNAEAFAINPAWNSKHDNDRYIAIKAAHSWLYKLPPDLHTSGTNLLQRVTNRGTPIDLGPFVTDFCFTIDGRFALVCRKDENTTVFVHRPTGTTWDQVGEIPVPAGLSKIEAISMLRSGKQFVVTEDKGSAGAALITVPLPTQWQPIKPTVSPAPSPTPAPVAALPSGDC